jgi:hypothetical protein
MIDVDKFRERLRVSAKTKMDWARWLGSPTAWLALFVSSASLYFSFVRVNDDVRVVIGDSPIIFVDLNSRKLGVYRYQQHLTLINSGNRVALVSDISLNIGLTPQDKPVRCSFGTIIYDFPGVIIKPGEMLPVSLEHPKLPALNLTMVPTLDHVLVSFLAQNGIDSEIKNGEYFGVCLGFTVTTPDSVSSDLKIPLYATHVGSLAETLLLSSPNLLFSPRKPAPLINRSQTIFSTR